MQESSALAVWHGNRGGGRYQVAGRATGDPIPEPPFKRWRAEGARWSEDHFHRRGAGGAVFDRLRLYDRGRWLAGWVARTAWQLRGHPQNRFSP